MNCSNFLSKTYQVISVTIGVISCCVSAAVFIYGVVEENDLDIFISILFGICALKMLYDGANVLTQMRIMITELNKTLTDLSKNNSNFKKNNTELEKNNRKLSSINSQLSVTNDNLSSQTRHLSNEIIKFKEENTQLTASVNKLQTLYQSTKLLIAKLGETEDAFKCINSTTMRLESTSDEIEHNTKLLNNLLKELTVSKFIQLDQNNDNNISLEEFKSFVAAN